MATHSLTINLSDKAFQTLQHKIGSGRYATPDEAIENVLLESEWPNEAFITTDAGSFDAWLREEATCAYDEHKANPSEVYTPQQVLHYLAEQRAHDTKAG